MDFTGLIVLIFSGTLAIGCIGGIVYIWVRVLLRPRLNSGLATCGRCRYPVRGAATLNCSECGCDFRVFGIRTPAMQIRFISPLLFILLWTICFWPIAMTLAIVAVTAGPTANVYNDDILIDPPDSKASGYGQLTLAVTPYGGEYNFTAYSYIFDELLYPLFGDFIFAGDTYYLDIYDAASTEWLEINLDDDTYLDLDSHITTSRPYDRAVLEAWMGSIGADLNNKDVQAEIDELFAVAEQAKTQRLNRIPFSRYTSSSYSTYNEQLPQRWVAILQPVLWLTLYFGGLLLYFYIRRRYQRAVDRMIAEMPAEQPLDPPPVAPASLPPEHFAG